MYSSTGGRQDNRGSLPGSALIVWLALALLLLPLGVVGILMGRSADDQRFDAIEEATALELIEIRNRMTWLHHDLLTDGLTAELNGSELEDARLTLFETQRASAIGEIQEIADGDTDWSNAASSLLDLYNSDSYAGRPFLAMDLDELHFFSATSSETPELAADWPEHDVRSVQTMLPRLVLIDALTVAVVQSRSGPSDWSADFVELTYDTLENGPGWLGPERGSPLVDNVLMGPGEFELSPGLETTAALSELRLVWDYDQWLIIGAEDSFSDQPPMSLEQLTLAANAATNAMRSDAAAAVGNDLVQVTSDTPAQFVSTLWYVVGAGSLLVGLAIAATLLFRLLRRHGALAETALTDPLTGAKNRRYLDTEVIQRCGRPGGHHVLAMVDLDRFKLVNDTWGHDVGDVLLQTLTDRLQGAAASLSGARTDVSTAIVRTGGDEFVVAIHSDQPLDMNQVEQRLRALTGPLDLGQEDMVELEFSLGIVGAQGPVDLAGLLKAADLAAYEDKKNRATDRQLDLSAGQAPVSIEIP